MSWLNKLIRRTPVRPDASTESGIWSVNGMCVNDPVKFIGGKYNGLVGNIAKLGTAECSVHVVQDNKPYELVESVKFLRAMTDEELNG